MSVHEQVVADNVAALKSGDAERRRVLSYLASELASEAKNKKINILSDEQAVTILIKNRKRTRETADALQGTDRTAALAQTLNDIQIVEGYLPAQPTEERVREFVTEMIALTHATSVRDTGKIIQAVVAVQPAVDKSMLSRIIKEKLS